MKINTYTATKLKFFGSDEPEVEEDIEIEEFPDESEPEFSPEPLPIVRPTRNPYCFSGEVGTFYQWRTGTPVGVGSGWIPQNNPNYLREIYTTSGTYTSAFSNTQKQKPKTKVSYETNGTKHKHPLTNIFAND
jgi:hypothetical protein